METLISPASEWNGMANSAPIRLILTRLLSLTNGESVKVETLRGSLRITSETFETLLQQLIDEELVSLQGNSISLEQDQRLNLAMKAVKVGADSEVVSRSLTWLEFEEISAKVFEVNGFHVLRRFRFTAEGRRWELDLLAIRTPYLVCGECKHWGKGIGNKTARGIIETHLRRLRYLPSTSRRLKEEDWDWCLVEGRNHPHGFDPLSDAHGDISTCPFRLYPRTTKLH